MEKVRAFPFPIQFGVNSPETVSSAASTFIKIFYDYLCPKTVATFSLQNVQANVTIMGQRLKYFYLFIYFLNEGYYSEILF